MNTLKIETYFNHKSDKLALYKSNPESNSSEHNHEFDELVIVEHGHGLHVIYFLNYLLSSNNTSDNHQKIILVINSIFYLIIFKKIVLMNMIGIR